MPLPAQPGAGTPALSPLDAAPRATGTMLRRIGLRRIGLRDPALQLGAIAGLALVLRVVHLGSLSLWSDEIFSRYYYDLFGPGFLWTQGLRVEPTPPLYYMVLEAWMQAFGGSEVALRSLSVCGSMLALPLVYLLGRELGMQRGAVLAAFLFAICPFALYFAQEARVYALALVPTSLALLGVAIVLREPRSVAGYTCYGVGALLCLYFHATLVLFVAACQATMLPGLVSTKGRARWAGPVRWLLTNAIVALAALPYLLALPAASHAGGLDWMPPLTVRSIVSSLVRLVGGMLTPPVAPGAELTMLVLGLLAVSVWVSPPSRRTVLLLLLIPGLYFVLVLSVSLVRPILLPRTLGWMVVTLCLLAARRMESHRTLELLQTGSVTATFLIGLVWQVGLAGGTKEPWRDAIGSLDPGLRTTDLVVMSPRSNPMILSYYGPPDLQGVRLWDAQLRPTIDTAAAARLAVRPISEAEILNQIEAGRSVTVIGNFPDLSYLSDLAGAAPGARQTRWYCEGLPCISVARWNVAASAAR